MTGKVTVRLTQAQASALRLAADYILHAGESPTELGWSPGTVRALTNADAAIARATGTEP